MTDLSKLQRWVGGGLLAIILVMPFHAFLAVWLGSLTQHETIWQAWKEVALLLTILGVVVLAWQSYDVRRRLTRPLPVLIYLYMAMGLLVSVCTHPHLTTLVYGAKTDFEFLAAFLVASAIAEPQIAKAATKLVLAGVAVVGLIGTLQAFVLPKDILSHFGYGPHTIAPFENLTAQVSSFRILSTLGGPNQLGSYLILPICLLVALMIRQFRWWQPILLALALVSLWHTYSRSAWLATLLAVGITAAMTIPKRLYLRVGIATGVAAILVGGILVGSIARHNSLQAYILHGSLAHYTQIGSDAQRLASQQHGLELVRQQPLGRGLGSAGPASKYGSDYTITENYYLQLAVEVGIVGLALFIALELLLARQLWLSRNRLLPAAALTGTIAGISLINFFLHGWADSSTALIYWTYAGLVLGSVYTESSRAK